MKIAGVLLESGRLRIQSLRNHDSWCHGQSEEMSDSLYTYRRLSAYWLNSMAEDTWKLSRRQAITRVPDKVKMVKFRCGFWSDLCEKSCTSILLQVPPAKSAMEEPQATAEAIAGVLRRCLCHCKRTPLNLYPPHETSQSSMIGKDLESWAWSFSV